MVSEADKKLWNEVAVRFRAQHAAWVSGRSAQPAPDTRAPSTYDAVAVIRQVIDAVLRDNPDLRETYEAAYAAVKNKTYPSQSDAPGGPRFFFEQFLDKLAVMRTEGLDLDVRALPVFREYALSNAAWYPRLVQFLQFIGERHRPFMAFIRECLALREEYGGDARTRRAYLQRRNALFRKWFSSDVDQTSSSGFIAALESDIEYQEQEDRLMFLDCLGAVIGREQFASELPAQVRSRIDTLRSTAENLLEHIERITSDTLSLPEQRTYVPLRPELITFKPFELDVRTRARLARYRLDNPLLYLMLALIGCPVSWMVFKVVPATGAWAVPLVWKTAGVLPLGPSSIWMQQKLGIPGPDSRMLAAGLVISLGIALVVYLVRLPYTVLRILHRKKVLAELQRRNEAERRRIDALNQQAVQRVEALNEERRREIEEYNRQVEARAPFTERIRAAYRDFERRKPEMADELRALIGELNALHRLTETAVEPAALAGLHVRLNACVSRMTITADRVRALLRTLTDEMGIPAPVPSRLRAVERRKNGERTE